MTKNCEGNELPGVAWSLINKASSSYTLQQQISTDAWVLLWYCSRYREFKPNVIYRYNFVDVLCRSKLTLVVRL